MECNASSVRFFLQSYGLYPVNLSRVQFEYLFTTMGTKLIIQVPDPVAIWQGYEGSVKEYDISKTGGVEVYNPESNSFEKFKENEKLQVIKDKPFCRGYIVILFTMQIIRNTIHIF